MSIFTPMVLQLQMGVIYCFIPKFFLMRKIFFLSFLDLGHFNSVCVCFVCLIHIYSKLQKLLNSLDDMFI